MRFRNESAGLISATQNGRVSIHRDAFEFFKTSPVLGTGLGNFRSLSSPRRGISLRRRMKRSIRRATGFGSRSKQDFSARCFLVAGLALWVRRSVPFAAGTWRAMRVAALICGVGFAVHGIFDVSGHRLGSLWPGLLPGKYGVEPANSKCPVRPIAANFFEYTGPSSPPSECGGWPRPSEQRWSDLGSAGHPCRRRPNTHRRRRLRARFRVCLGWACHRPFELAALL